jgi:uracil-DNA glycosylase
MPVALAELLKEIRECEICADHLLCGPRPVLQAAQPARLRIIGQAPGRKVHETGIPWDDPSGNRLRRWLGLTAEQFYDPRKVAIVPMGFCYPGKASSGDSPPRPECAAQWHETLDAYLPNIKLTLLVGRYAQAHYLGNQRKTTLSDTVKALKEYQPLGYLPLPHPSPRNQPWLAKNPWFEEDLLPVIQAAVRSLKL